MRKRLTHEQVLEIVKLYPDTKSSVIAKSFNTAVRSVYGIAKRYGVHKSESFLNSEKGGRIQKGQHLSPETQFKKGHVSHNCGHKMEFVIKNEQKYANWREKCLWKKGNKPYNTGKDGEVRWRKNPGYYFIRYAENNWEFLHRHLWKEQYGDIPEGHNVVFKDGNRMNCVIENLECISNAELGERNRVTKYPYELQKAIKLNNKLIRLTNEKTNKH